jgi:hypothetical protein
MPDLDAALADLRAGRPAHSIEGETLEFKQEAATVRETL